MKSNPKLSRRTVLRGAGCTVALPWLESMVLDEKPMNRLPFRAGLMRNQSHIEHGTGKLPDVLQ